MWQERRRQVERKMSAQFGRIDRRFARVIAGYRRLAVVSFVRDGDRYVEPVWVTEMRGDKGCAAANAQVAFRGRSTVIQ